MSNTGPIDLSVKSYLYTVNFGRPIGGTPPPNPPTIDDVIVDLFSDIGRKTHVASMRFNSLNTAVSRPEWRGSLYNVEAPWSMLPIVRSALDQLATKGVLLQLEWRGTSAAGFLMFHAIESVGGRTSKGPK